jgi:hypothetical protein
LASLTALTAARAASTTGATWSALSALTSSAHILAHVRELFLLIVGQNAVQLCLGFFFQIGDLLFLVVGKVQLILSERRHQMKAGLHSAGAALATAAGTLSARSARALALVRLSIEEARRCAECQRDEHGSYFHSFRSVLLFCRAREHATFYSNKTTVMLRFDVSYQENCKGMVKVRR